MKQSIKLISLILLISISTLGIAQGPPDPDPDPSGNGDNGIGGQAPLGSGLSVFIILGAVYGTRKTMKIRNYD